MPRSIILILLLILISLVEFPGQSTVTNASADQLIGLWGAKKRFGPDARGTLIIQKSGDGYIADIAGQRCPIRVENGELRFELANNGGYFRGRLEKNGIHGHWYRLGTVLFSPPVPGAPTDASLVILEPDGRDRWRGIVDPGQSTFTFYLMAQKRADGSIGVLLRNPERDQGNQFGVEKLAREGNTVKLIGRRRGDPEDRVLLTGTFDPENDVLSFYIPNRGLTYDFMREGDGSEFYRRGKNPGRYVYTQPVVLNDGWTSATPEDSGIDRTAIERLMQQTIETPESEKDTPQLHGILIARHGKLVLEEYFHGFDRDTLHNLRSASKSITATIIGAAMQAGVPLKLSDPVYKIMNGGKFPEGLDAQKRAMTLENLMTMSSGIFCDDNNSDAPGNESVMWDQTQDPVFAHRYMSLPMDRKPGEKAVYCSNDPNLALAMLGRAAGENPLYIFDRLIGEPMQIRRYNWPTDHAGNAYGGGGMDITLRDFAKFGQLMLNNGVWKGRRILSPGFVSRASSPLTRIGSREYGLLWWIGEYSYKDKKVKVYWALGNGGQNITVIPDLDMVIASFSGSYFTSAYGWATGELIPNLILPAVADSIRAK